VRSLSVFQSLKLLTWGSLAFRAVYLVPFMRVQPKNKLADDGKLKDQFWSLCQQLYESK
jgi:hypothetical protein